MTVNCLYLGDIVEVTDAWSREQWCGTVVAFQSTVQARQYVVVEADDDGLVRREGHEFKAVRFVERPGAVG